MQDKIPVGDCVNGGLYLIHARNFGIGVYKESSKGFIGVREKFGHKFLDTEYHWDVCESHGTVVPEKFLENCPIENLEEGNQELFQWLEQKEREYDDDGNPRDSGD